MTVSSMTGFARTDGAADGFGWTWELRSVNGKGLDVRVRLNGGFERLEAKVRDAVSKRFKRGNIGVTLNVVRAAEGGSYQVNRELLTELVSIAQEFDGATSLSAGTIADLMNVRGVLETVETQEDEATRDARDRAVLASLNDAIDQMVAHRNEEGAKLDAMLRGHVDNIEATVTRAENCASARGDAIKERLKRQIDELMDAGKFDQERLHQEAALLATKADIREEIDRLKAHIIAARDMLTKGGAIGRKLDFLCQEFNREANTLCSKANDIELTNCGMELKVIIDQLREQVQNVE
ncbi:YicC/YloC family endoribonuclease [Thalassospira lucentensis]|uniref:YicC/YloC family endoribonuclease n=1 Tax=Thalassospira lucentensis TaxID=168935 RepID=UPI00142D84E7|nr:YicC/YloC family endoribonuclease [Thalassospira lucentensis]NIZ03352.1 YicC family protein [Thalassospira lucentensis]